MPGIAVTENRLLETLPPSRLGQAGQSGHEDSPRTLSQAADITTQDSPCTGLGLPSA